MISEVEVGDQANQRGVQDHRRCRGGALTMVDGTEGKFCFAAAKEIQDLWRHICEQERDGEQKVSEDNLSGF